MASKPKAPIMFPLDCDGNLMYYANRDVKGNDYPTWSNGKLSLPTWVPDLPFTDTLVFYGFFKGASTSYMQLKSTSTGAIYHMTTGDIDPLIKKYGLPAAGITHTWRFVKKSSVYALTWEGPL